MDGVRPLRADTKGEKSVILLPGEGVRVVS